jgi:tyrosine-protein phosphatase YwqE
MGLFSIFRKQKTSISESGVLKGFCDCHTHLLPGVDDGVATIEQSLEVLAYMESQGVCQVWCTPHVMDDIPNPTELLQQKFEELKAAYKGPVKLNLAAEYMLDSEFEKRLAEGDLLKMWDDVVLVETSTNIPPYNLLNLLENIMSKGYRPMLAHPERYRYMDVADYRHLREIGVYYQLNLPSVVGYYGETAANKALRLLREGSYYAVGSDCHKYSSILSQFNRAVLPDEVIADIRKAAMTSTL